MNPLPSVDVRDVTGPYSPTMFGSCSDGHPVNQSGRCEPLNMAQYPNAETAKLNDATYVRAYVAPEVIPDAGVEA